MQKKKKSVLLSVKIGFLTVPIIFLLLFIYTALYITENSNSKFEDEFYSIESRLQGGGAEVGFKFYTGFLVPNGVNFSLS